MTQISQVDTTQPNQNTQSNNPPTTEPIVVSDGVQELSDRTSASVLKTIYRDSSMLRGVLDILIGRRNNPSDLVEGLQAGRQEFQKIQQKKEVQDDEDSLKDAL